MGDAAVNWCILMPPFGTFKNDHKDETNVSGPDPVVYKLRDHCRNVCTVHWIDLHKVE